MSSWVKNNYVFGLPLDRCVLSTVYHVHRDIECLQICHRAWHAYFIQRSMKENTHLTGLENTEDTVLNIILYHTCRKQN